MGKQHTYRTTVRWTGNTGVGTGNGYRGYGRAAPCRQRRQGEPSWPAPIRRFSAIRKSARHPEEFLVASLAQCHMLTYLSVCARDGATVTAYEDAATGTMEEAAGHSGRFTEVVLRPVVTVADAAMAERARSAHHDAHQTCFIANSVNFPVGHEPTIRVGG